MKSVLGNSFHKLINYFMFILLLINSYRCLKKIKEKQTLFSIFSLSLKKIVCFCFFMDKVNMSLIKSYAQVPG